MTKVSVYIDDPVWLEFKQRVMRKCGSLRKLSAEVEGLIREANVETEVVCGLEKLGVQAKGNISSQEIKANRPKSRGPPSKTIIEQMRKQRVDEILSRH